MQRLVVLPLSLRTSGKAFQWYFTFVIARERSERGNPAVA